MEIHRCAKESVTSSFDVIFAAGLKKLYLRRPDAYVVTL